MTYTNDPRPSRKPLIVRVTLSVEVDREAYEAEYGHVPSDDDLRQQARYLAGMGFEAGIGVATDDIFKATLR